MKSKSILRFSYRYFPLQKTQFVTSKRTFSLSKVFREFRQEVLKLFDDFIPIFSRRFQVNHLNFDESS